MRDSVHTLAYFQCGSHSSVFLGVYRLKANAGNSRCAGSPCVFHIWTSLLLYFDSKFQEVLPCTKRLCNNLFIDDTGPLLFCSLSCDSEGIMKGSRVPITILCIQSDSCRKTALQRFAEFLNELTRRQRSRHRCLLWRHLPITASCLGTNQSPSLSAPVKNGLFYFPRFSVGGWHHFECGFVVQTALFYFFFFF